MDEKRDLPTRSQVDNPYKRNIAPDSYKNRHFNGYRVSTDEYTGRKVFYAQAGANAPDGRVRHFTPEKTANVDHIVPIDVLKERWGNILSAEELSIIANSDYNLAVTNEALNKSKGRQRNRDYLKKQWENGTPEDINTSVNMLTAEIKAEVHNVIQKESLTIKKRVEQRISSQKPKQVINATNDVTTAALHSGSAAALVSLTVSGVNNLAYVASGKKDVQTAIKDIATDTAGSFVSASGLEATQQIVTIVAKKTASQTAVKIAAVELPIAEISMAIMTASSIKRYMDGETSAEDCAIEILLNGAGTLAFQLGMTLGGPAGAIVASVVASQITNAVLIYRQEIKEKKIKDEEIERILSDAMAEIMKSKEELDQFTKKELKRWRDSIDAGYNVILHSALERNPDGLALGLNAILDLFNSKVIYSSSDEFDKDFKENFFDKNAEPILF